MLRHHGSRQTYLHERVGWNSRLDELQAAVLRVKLRHLDGFNAARRKVAQRYREKLAGAKVMLPAEHGRGTHVYHQFTIRSEKRDAIREALGKEGIASSVFYPMPLHQQPAYKGSQERISSRGGKAREDRAVAADQSAARRRVDRPHCRLRPQAPREARVHQDAWRGQRFCRARLHPRAVRASIPIN